jgi:hypothetical protein
MTVNVNPSPVLPSKWVLLLKSRKFWAAIVGLGLVIFRAYQPAFPIDDDQLSKIILVLIAYIIGTAFEDGAAAYAVRGLQPQGDAAQSQRDASLSQGDTSQSQRDASL